MSPRVSWPRVRRAYILPGDPSIDNDARNPYADRRDAEDRRGGSSWTDDQPYLVGLTQLEQFEGEVRRLRTMQAEALASYHQVRLKGLSRSGPGVPWDGWEAFLPREGCKIGSHVIHPRTGCKGVPVRNSVGRLGRVVFQGETRRRYINGREGWNAAVVRSVGLTA